MGQTPKNNAKNLAFCSLFIALITAGAFIKIPVPVVPFTLQFLFTTLSGLLLGPKLGAACVGAYILIGLLGLPVFAEGGGIVYVLKPSFGYLIGFAAGAYTAGAIANKTQTPGLKRLLAANFAGLFVVYLFGTAYYYLISNLYLHNTVGAGALLLYCVVLAVPGDVVLCVFSAYLAKKILPVIKKYGVKK